MRALKVIAVVLLLVCFFMAGMEAQEARTDQANYAADMDAAEKATAAIESAAQERGEHGICSSEAVSSLQEARDSTRAVSVRLALWECAVNNLAAATKGTAYAHVVAQVAIPSSDNAMVDLLRVSRVGSSVEAALSAAMGACGTDTRCVLSVMSDAGWSAEQGAELVDGNRVYTIAFSGGVTLSE